MQSEKTTAVAVPDARRDVRDLLEKLKPQIAMALPRHITPERMLRVTMTAVQRTPALLECDRLSLARAVIECSELGLEPSSVLGHAFLVPYKNRKTGRSEVQLQVGYKGFIALARRSGEVTSISAAVVREGDVFEYERGTKEFLRHRPCESSEGAVTHVWACAHLKDGGTPPFEVLSLQEVEKVRKGSPAGQRSDSPWATHWDEMAKKTAIRRLAKYLPLSTEFNRAQSLDELAEAGLSQDLGEDVAAVARESEGRPTSAALLRKLAAPAEAAPAPADDPDLAASDRELERS